MYDILRSAIERNASDIHITENKIGWLRVQGTLEKFEQVVHLDEIDSFIEIEIPTILSSYEELRKRKRMNPIDGAFKFNDRRFRINIYFGLDGINVAVRLLSDEILPLEKLFLPPEIELFAWITSGLYLVVGTTGSGKSTTLASLIRSINEERAENILTVEQPIEYIHKPIKSRIEQIEVGIHVDSFETATVAAMRQNPNIIFVGEMRELQTIQNAITLAETGHVVYRTLHAKSVIDSIDRIIDVFPAKQQEQVRFQVARVLKGVMHQMKVFKNNHGGFIMTIFLVYSVLQCFFRDIKYYIDMILLITGNATCRNNVVMAFLQIYNTESSGIVPLCDKKSLIHTLYNHKDDTIILAERVRADKKEQEAKMLLLEAVANNSYQRNNSVYQVESFVAVIAETFALERTDADRFITFNIEDSDVNENKLVMLDNREVPTFVMHFTQYISEENPNLKERIQEVHLDRKIKMFHTASSKKLYTILKICSDIFFEYIVKTTGKSFWELSGTDDDCRSVIFDFVNGDFSWKKVLYGNPTLTIFQLSGLQSEIKKLVSDFIFMDFMYYIMLHGSLDKPCVLWADECQTLNFKKGSPLYDILMLGRKFGVSAMFCSQFLHGNFKPETEKALSTAATRLIFRPTDSECKYLANQYGIKDESELSSLKKLECIAYGKFVDAYGNVMAQSKQRLQFKYE